MSKLHTQLIALVFSTGVTLGTGLGVGFQKALTATPPSIGISEYLRLRQGMSLTDVEAILGRGTEIEQTKSTSTYIWRPSDNSKLTAIFKEGKLEQKSQEQLR